VARRALIGGDLRTLSEEQRERIKAKMKEIVSQHLPKTSSTIEFEDRYPPMAPTSKNRELLNVWSDVSVDLGIGPVTELDPSKRGAADVSFVAPYVPAVDGLGVLGGDEHAPGEHIDLRTFPRVIERAAVLIYRLTQDGR